VKVVGVLVVEYAGADLEREVGTTRCPAHLLSFVLVLADDRVDRGLVNAGERASPARWRSP
jgi:hypothetical protein